MFLGGIPRRPDKEEAYSQLRAHLTVLGVWIAAIRLAPFVLHAVIGGESVMGDLKAGIIVQLPELKPSSQYYKELQSLRLMGLLESYSAQTGLAVITHGGATFRVDTQNLRNLELRTGSLYQFVGELFSDPALSSELMLQARVGRNVDGLDLDLYNKALEIRRQFELKYLQDTSPSS